MEFALPSEGVSLNATAVRAENPYACMLFLPGGALDIGRERYHEWQNELARTGISSLSFDYSGVNGSGTSLGRSSLKSRIEEAVCAADWMVRHMPARRYALYGVSMGGYIALGLTHERKGLFDKLILHAPAAYSKRAHTLRFGDEFTSEIRKEGNWEDSPSFEWLRSYRRPLLLIEAKHDEIIPGPIIEKYKNIKEDEGLTLLLLKNSAHSVWGNSAAEKKDRDDIYKKLEDFVRL